MPKKFAAAGVITVIAITIAAEAFVAVWSSQLSYESRALDPSIEPLIYWALVASALIGVVAIVGPQHERIWLIALLAVVVTVAGSFFVGHIVLGVYQYRRDYTSLPVEENHLARVTKS